jgi:hypothetical protein
MPPDLLLVALKMSDQSRRFGISIDASGLGEIPQERFDALLTQFVQLPPPNQLITLPRLECQIALATLIGFAGRPADRFIQGSRPAVMLKCGPEIHPAS